MRSATTRNVEYSTERLGSVEIIDHNSATPGRSVEQSSRLATYHDQDAANRQGWQQFGDDGQMVG
jgi:hypothetical protein